MNVDKINQFYIKLIKLTNSGDLVWTSKTPNNPELENGEIIVDKLYQTKLNEANFCLFKYKYKYYHDEFSYEWLPKVRLELQDSRGYTDYEFEYDNTLSDLYEIVRERTSNVSKIIDDILELKLEIVEAIYYTASKSTDVTKKLQALIDKNRLVIEASNNINGDPDPGTLKQLKIKYKYAGKTREKICDEGQTMVLP